MSTNRQNSWAKVAGKVRHCCVALVFLTMVAGILAIQPPDTFADGSASCPLTQGYWKNHSSAWETSSLTLGTSSYTANDAEKILKTPVRGDASLILAHELIAALLNLANGAPEPTSVTNAIADADAALAAGPIPEGIAPSSALGQQMVTDAEILDNYNNGLLTPACGSGGTAPPPGACSGQGLIGIDPVNNVGYAPIYTLDTNGNGQLAMIDLNTGTVLGTISLPGAVRAIALAYNPNNATMIAESETLAGGVEIVVVPTTLPPTVPTASSEVSIPGLLGFSYGGILEDTVRNEAVVAGVSTVGILDTSTNPPTWNATSAASTATTDSLSLNLNTHMLFISGDGNNQIIDTSTLPLAPIPFNSTFGITDGNAFDVTTNTLLLSQEVSADQTWAFNFSTLTTTPLPATASNVAVPDVCSGGLTGCLGESYPLGEGPGGEVSINCSTHQGIVADEFGQNLKLVQLPTAPVTGALDNNGRPGSGVSADAASVYTIAATVIPQGVVGTTPTQLGIIGDPNSLSVDPIHNFAYMLADTTTYYHPWTPGSTLPLFLIKVDLSAPVSGANPLGGVNGSTFWTPTSQAIRLP